MAQRKETKKTIKVRDLKPKKDAKGGVATNVSTNRSVQGHQIQSRQLNQANRQI
jgi:hypothetical protein